MDLPLEIERKFLVALPEESDLRKHAARCIAITQTYLLGTQEGASKRIRRSEEQGTVTYTSTEKTRIDMLQRIEIERELSEEEYRELQKQRRQGPSAAPQFWKGFWNPGYWWEKTAVHTK